MRGHLELDEPAELPRRDGRRRHRARDLGHAGALHERHHPGGDGRAVATDRPRRGRGSDQGLRHRFRQGGLLGRRRPDHAAGPRRALSQARQGQGRGSRHHDILRGVAPPVAPLPPARDVWKTLRRRGARGLSRRRLRAGARLPPPRPVGRGGDPRRSARDQGRAVPRGRRHAAGRPPDADRRRLADAVQGRADPRADGPQHGPRARGGRQGRDRRQGQGLDQGRRLGGGSLGSAEIQAAVQQGLFAGRHDDLAAGQRHLPARDARQLPGRESHSASRLRGPAAADGLWRSASRAAISRRSCARRRRRR